MTDEQVPKLARWERIVHLADGNAAGLKFARQLAAALGRWVRVVVVEMTQGVDPDEMKPEDLRDLLKPWL